MTPIRRRLKYRTIPAVSSSNNKYFRPHLLPALTWVYHQLRREAWPAPWVLDPIWILRRPIKFDGQRGSPWRIYRALADPVWMAPPVQCLRPCPASASLIVESSTTDSTSHLPNCHCSRLPAATHRWICRRSSSSSLFLLATRPLTFTDLREWAERACAPIKRHHNSNQPLRCTRIIRPWKIFRSTIRLAIDLSRWCIRSSLAAPSNNRWSRNRPKCPAR